MNILIINLTRMGDVVQSTLLLRGLKKRHPGCTITYIVNEPYAEICEAIPEIDELLLFDMKGYQERLLSGTISIVENYRYLEGFIEEINKKEYDLLINLTPSKVCAALTSLVKAKDVRGLTIDGEGNRLVLHPWMKYLAISVSNRAVNPFNLVDMYGRSGDVEEAGRLSLTVPERYRQGAEEFFKKSGAVDGSAIIAFQPGASNEHKRWLPRRFAELGKKLVERLGARVFIFGSHQEEFIGKEISERIGDGAVDMTGKTSIMELAAMIERCSLLVTNDSGTMHIATALGVRVVELSLGAAYFRETGPYGDGHIVVKSLMPCHPCSFHVKCTEMACRNSIKAEDVYKIVEAVISGKDKSLFNDRFEWKGVEVYRSFIDDEGFLDFVPLIEGNVRQDDIYAALYRIMWKVFLNKYPLDAERMSDITPDTMDDNARDILRSVIKRHSVVLSNDLIISIKADMDVFKKIKETAQKGIFISKDIIKEILNKNKNIDKIKELNHKLLVLDERIREIGFANPLIMPFAEFFRCGKESLPNEKLLSLARKTLNLYKGLYIQTSMVFFLYDEVKDQTCVENGFDSEVYKQVCEDRDGMKGVASCAGYGLNTCPRYL